MTHIFIDTLLATIERASLMTHTFIKTLRAFVDMDSLMTLTFGASLDMLVLWWRTLSLTLFAHLWTCGFSDDANVHYHTYRISRHLCSLTTHTFISTLRTSLDTWILWWHTSNNTFEMSLYMNFSDETLFYTLRTPLDTWILWWHTFIYNTSHIARQLP